MPAGRRPQPTNMRVINGNPGKRALPTNEPKPRAGLPPCPKGVSALARKMWTRIGDELDRMGVMTHADGPALELLVDAYAEWRQARDVVEDLGATYESETEHGSIVRARPEVAIAADAWRRCKAMLVEFGATPAARTKVEGERDAAGDPVAEMLQNRPA